MVRALRGPAISPLRNRVPPTYIPSVQAKPTSRPDSASIWLIKRAVVVLPFVPVTATIGIRAGLPGGNSASTIFPPASRGFPSVG